jgi:hypothetical protein
VKEHDNGLVARLSTAIVQFNPVDAGDVGSKGIRAPFSSISGNWTVRVEELELSSLSDSSEMSKPDMVVPRSGNIGCKRR